MNALQGKESALFEESQRGNYNCVSLVTRTVSITDSMLLTCKENIVKIVCGL